MKQYSAFLFDMDGTLVNSEKYKGIALSETCSLFGGKAETNTYKAVMGENWSIVTNYFFKTAKISPDINDFNAEFRKIYKRYLIGNLSLNPNAKELLIQLKERSKKIAVVSSAAAWMVDQILVQLKLTKYFNLVITQEHVTKHKPDPEAYNLALKQLAISSSEALIFEDSNAGLIAANRAGCDSIAFQHEFNINNDLSLATRIISNFRQIKL